MSCICLAGTKRELLPTVLERKTTIQEAVNYELTQKLYLNGTAEKSIANKLWQSKKMFFSFALLALICYKHLLHLHVLDWYGKLETVEFITVINIMKTTNVSVHTRFRRTLLVPSRVSWVPKETSGNKRGDVCCTDGWKIWIWKEL